MTNSNLTINLPSALNALAQLFAAKGVELYAVGGVVRNTMLGLPINDIDITSRMLPDEIISLCANNSIKTLKTGYSYGMVEIHIGGCRFEHTTFRRDVYSDGGAHRPNRVTFSDSIEEDAFRRDFTVNAIYLNILTGNIIDPTGGAADIAARVIRATSRDPRVIMGDDALRIMRMARFASELGFDVERGTFAAAKQFSGQLADISLERVRDELKKLLLSDVKYGTPPQDSVLKGLALLDSIGALNVILPQLAACKGVLQNPQYHRFDVMTHMLYSAACAAPNEILRFAALLHDVAKPIMLAKNGNMHEHEVYGAIITREIMTKYHFSNSDIDTAEWLVRHHMFDLRGEAKESTLRLRFVQWGVEKTLLLADMREADFKGSVGCFSGAEVKSANRWRTVIAKMQSSGTPFSENALNCTGDDIMRWLGIEAGTEVGRIKHALLLHCGVIPQDNTPERLESAAKSMARSNPH